LHSRFPTKLKIRFFGQKTADELTKEDPLLRRLMPLAKKVGPTHTIETAKAVALLGGAPSQLSGALMQAQGQDFNVEKAEFGYMIQVLRPTSEEQLHNWSESIAGIGAQVRALNIEKLDAAYVALSRSAEASLEYSNAKVKLMERGGELSELPRSADEVLNELINAYFSTQDSFSQVVSGSKEECDRVMRSALGREYSAPGVANRQGVVMAGAVQKQDAADVSRCEAEADVVYSVVMRLTLGSDWPKLPTDEPAAVARVVAQFLAGIGSLMMPAKNWRTHRCWGRFRQVLEFPRLEELVLSAMEKHRAQQADRAKKAAAASASSSSGTYSASTSVAGGEIKAMSC